MKAAASILSILFLSLVGSAALPTNPTSALKDIQKHYRDVKTLQAGFTESFKWQMTGETVNREGKIIVAEKNRFRVDTPEQVMVSDGTNLYRFNRQRNQVMIEPAGKAEALLPNKILLRFAEDFQAIEISPLAVEGREGYRLELKPDDPDKALLASATLWVTSADLTVQRIKLIDLNGNSTTYTLRDIHFDQPIDSSAVSFTLPAGAELFDLR